MNDVNFTQLASDGKQAANIYDYSFDRIEALEVSAPTTAGAQMVLNRVHMALRGIAAVNQILQNNLSMDDAEEMKPMGGYLVGGLMAAQQALADMSIDCIETFADREQVRKEGLNG